MSLKIPICLVPGTASESHGLTTTYSLSSSSLNTPDPLGVVATAASTSPDRLTATRPRLATVSLVSSPSPVPQPSVELTWAPTGSKPRIQDSDESGLALFNEILRQQETGTKTTKEGQGEELRSLRLEELTDETLAQEALNQAATTTSGSTNNTPVAFKTMGDLNTPAIFFDDDASDYFDITRETLLAPGNTDTTNSNDGCTTDGGDRVIAELHLPVTSGDNFSSLWDTQVKDLLMEEAPAAPKMEVQHEPSMKEQIEAHAASAGFTPNPMACFNPLHVEGKMIVAKAEGEAEPLSKRKRSNLKLVIPPPQPQQQQEILSDQSKEEATQKQPPSLDTPAVEKALNVGEDGAFDLLEYVTNTELPVNDPGFLALISDTGVSPPTTSSVSGLATVNTAAIEHAAPTKDKRKHQATKASRSKSKRQAAAAASNSDHCYVGPSTSSSNQPRPSTSSLRRVSSNNDSSSAQSDDDLKEAKYRRMRDLNNLASKRCRQNRKRKFETLLEEEDELRRKNAELRMKCRHMEDLVGNLKKQFIQRVSNPALTKREPIDLDQILSQQQQQ